MINQLQDRLLMSEKQKQKFRQLMLYLNEKNEFYKEIIAQNSLDLQSDMNLIYTQLPIIKKKDIRKNLDKYLSKTDKEKVTWQLTSGTNGEPMKCYKTESERLIGGLSLWKERKKWDPHVTDQNFISLLDDGLAKRIGDFTNLDRKNMKACFSKLMELKPRWVRSSISVIEEYARQIENGYIEYKDKPLKFVELSFEFADRARRNYVEDVLECKTVNHYGIRETWGVAYECTEGHLHVLSDLIYVEKLPLPYKEYAELDSEISNLGEIAVTSFYNKIMPIIRYNLEDIADISYLDCRCGQSTLIIQSLEGRTSGIIKGSTGLIGELVFKRIIHNLICMGYDYIEKFRVEQIDETGFKLFIVKAPSYDPAIEVIIRQELCIALGKNVSIEFIFVDSILLTSSGKSKVFTCLI